MFSLSPKFFKSCSAICFGERIVVDIRNLLLYYYLINEETGETRSLKIKNKKSQKNIAILPALA
jgi:hypothetical protein